MSLKNEHNSVERNITICKYQGWNSEFPPNIQLHFIAMKWRCNLFLHFLSHNLKPNTILTHQILKLQPFNRINTKEPLNPTPTIPITINNLHSWLITLKPNITLNNLILNTQVNIINGYQSLLWPAHFLWWWEGESSTVTYASHLTVGSVDTVTRGEVWEAFVEIEEVFDDWPCLLFGGFFEFGWNFGFPSLNNVLCHFLCAKDPKLNEEIPVP